jgi:hypothetical protein
MRRETYEEIGARGARGGFAHERQVAQEFNNWQRPSLAQNWLQIIGIDLKEIKRVEAERLTGHIKTDVQVKVILKTGLVQMCNISCKKGGGNQIDKRWVDEYASGFGFSETTRDALKKFTGEAGYTPVELLAKGKISQSKYDSLKDKRRFAFPELEAYEQQTILTEFQRNKMAIIQFLLQGSGENAPQWFMKGYQLLPMKEAIRLAAADCQVVPTRSGFRIGDIKAQRKGGTPDPTKLQFKWDQLS